MIRVESETDDQMNCSVKIRTNKIDISKIGDKVWYTTEDYAGVKTSVSMTAQIFKVYYTAKQTGTYYDFYNKVTYPTYEYEKHEESVDIFDFDTVGGEAVLTFTRRKTAAIISLFAVWMAKADPSPTPSGYMRSISPTTAITAVYMTTIHWKQGMLSVILPARRSMRLSIKMVRPSKSRKMQGPSSCYTEKGW
jgi:hypothetical protein